MQTRSHARGEHIPVLPFEVWTIVLNILCKTMEDFPERCRIQRVCHAFRMDEHTILPCDKILSLTSNVKMDYLDAIVTCKHAFANIMELNLYGSVMSDADQLALSAVSWPHLGHVNLNETGIFDRPCALFLKKWLHTIRDAVKTVRINISSRSIDLLTFHYVCEWMNETRLKYIRVTGQRCSSYWYTHWEKYQHSFLGYDPDNSLVKNVQTSYDDALDCILSMNYTYLGVKVAGWQIPRMRPANPPKFRTMSLLPECPMEQDWYLDNRVQRGQNWYYEPRVKLVLKKPRTSGRGKMSIFTRESSY